MAGNIFLGDVFRAVNDLRPTAPDVLEEVLRMLRLDRLEVEAATSIGSVFDPRVLKQPADAMPEVPSRPAESIPPAPSTVTTAFDSTLRQLSAAGTVTPVPAWAETVAAAPRPAAPVPPARPVPPLFPARQARALLSAALATRDEDGPVDTLRLVELLSRREAFRALPREVTATLRRGAQVLVDVSPGMMPFASDVRLVLAQLDAIVADDQMPVYFFRRSPAHECVRRGVRRKAPWMPPARGTPVYLLTDLGIGMSGDATSAAPSEWLAFARRVRAAGCRLSALVPYGPRRWPRGLGHAINIIHWDRRTTAALVRRGVARAERVLR